MCPVAWALLVPCLAVVVGCLMQRLRLRPPAEPCSAATPLPPDLPPWRATHFDVPCRRCHRDVSEGDACPLRSARGTA